MHEVDSGDIEVLNTWNIHEAAKTNDPCAQNPTLCNKISFIGDFSNDQKNRYLSKEATITNFVDNYNAQKKSFLNALQTMQINNKEWKRWYATRDKVVLNTANIDTDDEFYQVSTHELGHIADLWFLQGKNKDKDTIYTEFSNPVFAKDDPSLYFYKLSRDSETIRKAEAKKTNFCSSYGMSDPFEDFAECFNLYINHNKVFRFLAQKDKTLGRKYNFLASMFKWSYLYDNTSSIGLFKNKTDQRVRDTTQIPIK